MLKNKTVEITCIENVPYKIVWIYLSKNSNSFVTYKRSYKNKEVRSYGKYDKCTDITLKNNEISSFSAINCSDFNFENKLQNYDFCKKIGNSFWKINSFIDVIFYVDEKLQTCFDTNLIPSSPKVYRTFEVYNFWAISNLNSMKIDTYYDKLYQRKVVVYRQNKKNNPLVNRSKVINFLLCCNRKEFLPELIPEVLKFITYT